LTWEATKQAPILERIAKITHAMLSLKEIEYLGAPQIGSFVDRQKGLVDHLLDPLEKEWLGKEGDGPIIPRIKALRMKIVPDLTNGELNEKERRRRWEQLSRIYLSQQIASYPPEYLSSPTTDTRILETVERLEEDLTDKAGVHGPMEVVIRIDEPIEVPADRAPKGEEDPIMKTLRERMQGMLDDLAQWSNPVGT
jgi:hypothetical protein